MVGGMSSSNNVQNNANQIQNNANYRPVDNNNNTNNDNEKMNSFQRMRQLATSEESIFIKSNNNNNLNMSIHETAVNHSLNSLMNVEEPIYNKGGLRRAHTKNSNNVYVSSEFILKPASENQGGNLKNFINKDNFEILTTQSAVTDVNYGDNNKRVERKQSRKKINIPSTMWSYEIHDINY